MMGLGIAFHKDGVRLYPLQSCDLASINQIGQNNDTL